MNQHVGNITEIINRNVVVSLLLRRGYNIFLPVYDDGIDFILHRRDDDAVIKVQLKSRLTIDRKYEGRGIVMVFPDRGIWYKILHDQLRDLVPESWLKTNSWMKGGHYTAPRLSVQMAERLAPFKLDAMEAVAVEAASSAADVESNAPGDVFEELRSFRRSRPSQELTIEEIIEMRDEGRRY